MFTLLTTWISQRIITVTAVSILSVAAVPTTLVIVSHDDHKTTTVAVIQPADDHTKTILISDVKKAGDDAIAKLNAAESSCDTQLTQTVSTSKVAARVQPALATAKSQMHSSVSPIIAALKDDEDHFAHLTFVTPQDEENELGDIHLIELIALGNGQTPGTVTITCQTVTVTITETIQITVVQQTPANCPPKPDNGDDD